MIDEERAFTLMMDALDGDLDAQARQELERYLAQQPLLQREWVALQRVHTLLVAAPPVAVPVNFAARTLARLPDPRRRRIFLSAFFVLLLLGGALPLLLAALLFAPQTAGAFGQSLGGLFEVARVLLGGVASSVRALLVSQPFVIGWLALMLVAVGAWISVYTQVLNTPQPAHATAPRRSRAGG